jgi:hypothetical protein
MRRVGAARAAIGATGGGAVLTGRAEGWQGRGRNARIALSALRALDAGRAAVAWLVA